MRNLERAESCTLSNDSEAEKNRARRELCLIGATGALFLGFEHLLHLKLEFIGVATLLWTAYAVRRLVRERGLAAQWGLRIDTVGSASPALLGFFAVSYVGLLCWHLAWGTRSIPAAAWVLFFIYPGWSFAQQFVLQALVALNLDRLGLARVGVVAVAAAMFGFAHFPDWPLMGLCAFAGAIWTAIFLRWRQLPLLAVTHAWLGILAYYWGLGRDPWGALVNH